MKDNILELLFIIESFICLKSCYKFMKMRDGAIKINVIKMKEAREVLNIQLLKAVYHFIVCLILWFTFRIK